jgi:hypothetical protein
MPLRFKNPRGPFPSGGYPFTDPKTGMKFDGMSADVLLQSRNVFKHRSANPKLWPNGTFTIASISQEIIEFTCRRLPGWCEDSEQPNQTVKAMIKRPAIKVPAGKVCQRCGSNNLIPTWCKTCGGSKLTGWHCNNCGAAVPK